MSPKLPPFGVGQAPEGAAKTGAKAGDVQSPDPPPCTDLSDREVALFEHVCALLRQANLEHLTAGLAIVVIVKTYAQWLEELENCENNGRYHVSQNGFPTEKAWSLNEKRLKAELGQWLPKACLTIPSLARVRKDTGAGAGQDDLFGDLVQHGRNSPAANSKH